MTEEDRTASQSSAHLLREARRAAGLTQNDVARRAGVTQSVVSAYESGRREPALPTLRRLIEAASHRLVTTVEFVPPPRPSLSDTALGRLLLERKAAILARVDRHRGSHVRVLRRVAWSRGLAGGDIDLLVDMAPEAGTFGRQALVAELTQLLGMPVGVTISGTLRPEIVSILEAEALPL